MNSRSYHDFFFLIIVFLLLLFGFLGPSFWKIPQAEFKISQFQKIFNEVIVNDIKKSTKFEINKNYLSSDQFNDKISVLQWSQFILNNVNNKIPIARMYFPYIPRNISEYETKKKKTVFIAILLPIALRGNELALEQRKHMKMAFVKNNINQIEYFSKKYRVSNFKNIEFSNLDESELNKIKAELLMKINTIPISMILSQAIIESGWGSSRFAQEGNALFGEWTWKNNDGIKPQQNLKANFSVKNFKNLLDSVNSYILNLNTHPAYNELRKYRSLQLHMGNTVTGYEMANFLQKYAEIGYEYVTKVTNMIKINKLNKFENLKLENF
jgi:Bax protein